MSPNRLPPSAPSAPATFPLRLAALALVGAAFWGCPSGATGPSLPKLEVIASDNPRAEADLRAARDAEDRGDLDEARERYAAFLEVWPADPAAPLAALSLGRIALDEGDLDEARRQFDTVAQSPDPALAEKGKLYGAVACQRAGLHEHALDILEPLRGRTVDPADTALLLYTIAEAQQARGDFLSALGTRDRMLRGELSASDRRDSEQAVSKLVDKLDPELALGQAYESLPRDGYAWPLVARRWLVESYKRADTQTVLRVGHDMDAQGLTIDEHLRELLVRAQRRDAADARVIGAILPLSGRGQEVGQSAMQGLMLAAGLPSDRPPGPDSFRVVYRDGAGDPDTSGAAVEDLASLHRAIAIIGPVARAAASEAARRATELGVPLIALSPSPEVSAVGERVYRLLPGPDEEAHALLAHARAYGASRIAVFHPDNGFGAAMNAAVQKAAQELGCDFAGSQSYPPGATSFGKEVEALVELAPEALFIADSAAQVSLIAPALAAGGYWSLLPGSAIPGGEHGLFLLPSTAYSESLANTTRRYLQGAVFSVPFDTRSGAAAEFADRYRAEFGEEPNVFAAYAYDAFQLLTASVEQGASTRTDVAARLLNVRLQNPVGPTRGFSPERGPLDAVRLQMLVGGTFSPVATGSGATKKTAGR